jgi:hypothetical protein
MLTPLTFKGVAHIAGTHTVIDMLLHQEKLALILLIGVTIAILCSYGILELAGKEAFSTRYSGDSPDGAPVVHEGRITGYTLARSGGHLILDVDGVTVFIPGQVAGQVLAKKDDRVRVLGIVQTYQGKKEIIVQNPRDLILQGSDP